MLMLMQIKIGTRCSCSVLQSMSFAGGLGLTRAEPKMSWDPCLNRLPSTREQKFALGLVYTSLLAFSSHTSHWECKSSLKQLRRWLTCKSAKRLKENLIKGGSEGPQTDPKYKLNAPQSVLHLPVYTSSKAAYRLEIIFAQLANFFHEPDSNLTFMTAADSPNNHSLGENCGALKNQAHLKL